MSDDSYIAYGRHILADISGAEPAFLNNSELLERLLVSAAVDEGVTVLGILKKDFDPSGVTILLLLAESHVSIHTYPDQGKAFFDAFTCGVDYEPGNILRAFFANVLAATSKITYIHRGSETHASHS